MPDEELDDIEEEEDEQKELITSRNIDSKVPKLEPYVLKALKSQGFYVIKEEEMPIINEDGTLDEEEVSEKMRQALKPISFTDVVDLSKKPPEINQECLGKNFIFYNGDGQTYYGQLGLQNYKDSNGTDRFVIVPNGRGRIYRDQKPEYAGWFLNGNKTQGAIYTDDGDIFLFDSKGDKEFEKHLNNDLLISIEGDQLPPSQIKQSFNEYSNILRMSAQHGHLLQKDGYDFNGVQNITIKIDNGYRYDFSKKNNDYLGFNGEPKKYSSQEEYSMFLNIDGIVDNLINVVNKCENTLKNIQIVVNNNFNYLKDKDGKNLINEIERRLRKKLWQKNVNLFLVQTGVDDVNVEAEEKFLNNEKIKSFAFKKRSYKQLNTETGEWKMFADKDDYEHALTDAGYYGNVVSIHDDSANVLDKSYALFDIDTDPDRVENIRKQMQNKFDEEIQKQYEQNSENMQRQIKKLKTRKPKRRKLKISEKVVVLVAGIFVPVFGGVIAYYFFSRPDAVENYYPKKVNDIKNNNNKNNTISTNANNKQQQSATNNNKTTQNTQNNGIDHEQREQKNVSTDVKINLNNGRKVENQPSVG